MDIFYADTCIGNVAMWKNDYAFSNVYSQNKVFEQDLVLNHLTSYIHNAKVILDVGAHIGSHSMLYSKINPNAMIHAFEPQKKMYSLLERNITHNAFSNIKIYNCALGHTERSIQLSANIRDGPYPFREIQYGGDTPHNLGGIQIGKGGEDAFMTTIDRLNLTDCSFIKMDVEGAEPLVLMGASNTLNKFRPVIMFEYNHKRITDEMIEMLDLHDIDMLSCFDILKNKHNYTSIQQLDKYGNYIALP